MEIPELHVEFVFRRRPVSLPADLRPGWRIGLVLLLLRLCSRRGRSSLTRLQTLSWAVRTENTRAALRRVLAGVIAPDDIVVRFDPTLNRALDFALGEGLLRRCGGNRIELSPKGVQLADALAQDESAFRSEKGFMQEVRQEFTEALVSRIFRGAR